MTALYVAMNVSFCFPHAVVFVGFWDEDHVTQLPYVWYVVVKSLLNMFVRIASPRGVMCVRCPMFIFSGPCEL